MKPVILLLLLTLMLGGCATAAPAEEPAAPATATTAPPIVTTASEPSATASAATSPPATPETVAPSPDAATQSAPTEAAAEATPAATANPITYGRTDDGAFFQGDPNAPVTLIDYSDFLWPTCRAYVLGTEPLLIADFVETGQVRIVFWPVLNHGNPSVYSTLTAHCAGEQDPGLFWAVHAALFERQNELWSADRDFYASLAESLGADRAAFEACYDGGEALAQVMALDETRLARGIFGQPTFDVNGQVFAGLQSYEMFQATIDGALSSQ